MRGRLLFCTFFAAAMVLLAANVPAFNRLDSIRDAAGYNVLTERVFKGTVAGEGAVIEGMTYFPLKTANAIVQVQIGPPEFVQRNDFKLRVDDIVTIVGVPVFVMNRQVVLAREVSSIGGTLTVRNQMGRPLWERELPILMDPIQGHS